MSKLQDKALEFASKKHEGQIDDSGRPYFFAHVVQVYGILKDITDDDEILVAGILHDTIEDTDATFEEIMENFTPNIAHLVRMLTHTGEKNDKGERNFPYLNISAGFEMYKKAAKVKFADRLSNLSRMDGWNDNRQEKYLERSRFWESVKEEST